MTVVTDGSEKIDQEAAIAALGDKASRYVVQTWTAGKAGKDS
ncbi:MAG: hypothetical protein P1U81_17365 [Verrucomicrobiales bacterium]|nr:hypothetical protein [Verrucomicrobiales bacterium]